MGVLVRTFVVALFGSLAFSSSAAAWIYWGHEGYGTGVGRAALDATQPNESFVAAPPGTYAFARGVAVDSKYLYWGTHGLNTSPERSFEAPRIGRSLLDGSGVEYTFTASTGQSISGLSASPTHLYWSANSQDTSEIGRTPIIGGQQFQSFGSVFGEPNPLPCGVASDGTYVYFANRATSSIGRATLANFSTKEQVIEGQWIQLPDTPSETVMPCGVAVDGKYVYWGVDQIFRNGAPSIGTTVGRALKAEGGEATDNFAASGRQVSGLAIDGAFIYTSNLNEYKPGGGSIGRANISGGGGDPDFITGLSAPFGVAVDAAGPTASPPTLQGPATTPVPPLIVGCNSCGGGAAPGSTVAPDFSRVWGTHTTFAPASWLTPGFAVAKSALAQGTVFNYILDKAGTVKIAILTGAAGRLLGRSCRAPSARNRGGRPCKRQLTVLTLTRRSFAGHNEVPFSGRVRGKTLKPGHYKALFIAKALTGSDTNVKSFSFRIAAHS